MLLPMLTLSVSLLTIFYFTDRFLWNREHHETKAKVDRRDRIRMDAIYR